MLDIISIEFLVVPLILAIGGTISLLSAIFGFYIMYVYMCIRLCVIFFAIIFHCLNRFRDDSCLMITYAVFLAIQFIILISGVGTSIKLLFELQTGLYDADVVTDMQLYETDYWVRYKWDTLQSGLKGF